MNNNPAIGFGLGLLGLIGVAVLLLAVWNMWREERAKRAQQPAPGPGPEAREVVRLLRDSLTGRMLIEIGGRRYAQWSEISDPAAQQGVLTAARDLQRFLGAPAETPAPPAAPAAPAPAPVNVALEAPAAPAPVAPAPVRPAPAATPAKPAALAKAAAETPTTPAGDGKLRLPTMNPFKQAQVLRELANQAAPPVKSIPEQMDEILQEHIAGTPLVQRGLSISLNPKGGVWFRLDGQTYAAIDEIPDPDVAAMIRAAVKEWEKRS